MPTKIVSPLLVSLEHCQELLLMFWVVLFPWAILFAGICQRVQFVFMGLQHNCSHCLVKSISIYHKGLLKLKPQIDITQITSFNLSKYL